MNNPIKPMAGALRIGMLAAALVCAPSLAQAAHHEAAQPAEPQQAKTRTMAIQAEAIVKEIDLETRQVTLEGPSGEVFTLKASEQVVKLEDVKVGDGLVVTYLAALEGELRAPTAEELAEPWLVMEEDGVSEDPDMPGVAAARAIRAVVTIEGMNRVTRTATVKDSNGKLHIIGDVEPEKMENVQLGQTAVLVFTEALALTLDKKEAAAEE